MDNFKTTNNMKSNKNIEQINKNIERIKTLEAQENLYDKICAVLTWYEHPDEYPFGAEDFNRHIADEMYDVLVRVQNECF